MTSDHSLCCNQSEKLATDFDEIRANESRTLIVVLLTGLMMIVEIIAGYITGSMALLADGYHMASHAGALGISYLVYRLARSPKLRKYFTFGTGKLLPLGGYSSAIVLGMIALWMALESVIRLMNPVMIQFNEAIIIAVAGLIVNLVSVWILGGDKDPQGHRDSEDSADHEEHHIRDHNHRSAILHVLADALTSVTAIIALTIGKYYSAIWLDPLMGVVGSAVILQWAYQLCKEAAWELLDGHAKEIDLLKVRFSIENSGHAVLDLHMWKVGPKNFVCQMIVESKTKKGADFFRDHLKDVNGVTHLIVEERQV